jgi:HAMP domain-containing protein
MTRHTSRAAATAMATVCLSAAWFLRNPPSSSLEHR